MICTIEGIHITHLCRASKSFLGACYAASRLHLASGTRSARLDIDHHILAVGIAVVGQVDSLFDIVYSPDGSTCISTRIIEGYIICAQKTKERKISSCV